MSSPGQVYGLGKYFFSKYHLSTDFISCESPLLKAPPSNIATLYNYSIVPVTNEREQYEHKVVIKRNAFAVCQVIRLLNEAAIHYKDKHCDPAKANYQRSLVFFDDMTTE